MRRILLICFVLISVLSKSQNGYYNGWFPFGNTVGTNTAYIGTNDNRSFYLKAFGFTPMKVDSIGGVSIYCPNPFNAYPLTIRSYSAGNSFLRLHGVNNSALVMTNSTTATDSYFQLKTTTGGAGLNNLSIGFSSNPDLANISFATDGTTRNLLAMKIGTLTAPTATLDVAGNVLASGTSTFQNNLNFITANSSVKIMDRISLTSYGAIYFSQSSPSSTNWGVSGDATNTHFNATSNIYWKIGGTDKMILTAGGGLQFSTRLESKQGANIASANDLSVGIDGNAFEITGTTQINLINNTGFQNGSEITLMFTSTPVVKNGQATSVSNIQILLAGGVDFSATANDILKLVLSSVGGVTAWREVSRSVN